MNTDKGRLRGLLPTLPNLGEEFNKDCLWTFELMTTDYKSNNLENIKKQIIINHATCFETYP